MSGSLQDQLLGAGLIQKQKAKNIQTAKKKAMKKSRANNTELVDEAAELAKKAQQEQRLKSQKLNAQQKRETEQKAVQAQIRQIIQLNSIKKIKDKKDTDDENVLSYNFTDENKIKTLHVSSQNHDLISRGRLAIAKLTESDNTAYHLIPVEAANKINERDSASIVLLNDASKPESNEIEDDPYADFQIPDDLMW
ncbi:MAG TPA: DUF2058 domain-containing protein [Leucothrix sp.]|nr:DUF2058 domain-containing protein [Leucothrix sp.]HIQ14702.1 DUF2058 domain-containing protein [Leucothrix sp.]